MPRQIRPVALVECENPERNVEAEYAAVFAAQPGGHDLRTIVRECDEPLSEGGVEMRSEQDAVEYVEAFGIARAVSPRLDVVRTKDLGDSEAVATSSTETQGSVVMGMSKLHRAGSCVREQDAGS